MKHGPLGAQNRPSATRFSLYLEVCEFRAGMCQRRGEPAKRYKPVARRREVRSSQVESSEGNPGSVLANQRPPRLAGLVQTWQPRACRRAELIPAGSDLKSFPRWFSVGDISRLFVDMFSISQEPFEGIFPHLTRMITCTLG